MRLIRVSLEEMERYWVLVRHLIEEAVKSSDGRYASYDILRALLAGQMVLFVAEDESVKGCAVVQVVDYPGARICKILCCTGKELSKWVHLLTGIEQWAKTQGCKLMEPVCRLGWAKVLEQQGYSRGHVLLKKVLE